jgi:hypothetical protein
LAPCGSDEEPLYVLVASGLTDDRLRLSLERANAVVEWLSERPDGESAARVLSEAAAEGRDAVFSAEQRAVVFDALHLRWKEPSRWIHFRHGLIDLYFELLVEFGEFGRSTPYNG